MGNETRGLSRITAVCWLVHGVDFYMLLLCTQTQRRLANPYGAVGRSPSRRMQADRPSSRHGRLQSYDRRRMKVNLVPQLHIDLVLAVSNCSQLLRAGSIARSATRRYLIYSEANFEVFRPAGATR